MNTKEILKKIKNNTISTNELKKFSKDKQVIIAAVKKNGSNLKFADKQLKADKEAPVKVVFVDNNGEKWETSKKIKFKG